MRISELRKHLHALASALKRVGARDSAFVVEAMSEGLKPFNTRDVSELESLELGASSDVESRPQVREFRLVLIAFEDFISRTAKPATRAAFNALKGIMNDHQNMAIRSFIDALDQAFSPDRPRPAPGGSIIDAYIDALHGVKHDDERFPRLFGQLSNDERLSKDDIVEIANRFAFKMAKSTSRKTALERIWKMHNASETFAAKSRAMKGKSAA